MTKRLLLLSNGHGEDNESAHIARAVQAAGLPIEMKAISIVGAGRAYRDAGVEVVGPTFVPPSNGFSYMDRSLLLQDIKAGLISATVGQWRAMRRHGAQADLIMATGDEFCQLFAWSSGRPFLSFIAPLSSLYTGRLNLDLMLIWAMRSRRCLGVLTREQATSDDLRGRGYHKVSFGGNPSVDFLRSSGVDLDLPAGAEVVGLLPGSRPPEADRNFLLQLRLAEKTAAEAARRGRRAPAFRAALVHSVMESAPRLAAEAGWTLDPSGHHLTKTVDSVTAQVGVWTGAFADIVQACTLVVAMAGQASDQALALGKPSFMFAGGGPQFNWRFAEAQYRYHGGLSRLVGDRPADEALLDEAARQLLDSLDDENWLAQARREGPERIGSIGSAYRFVTAIRTALDM